MVPPLGLRYGTWLWSVEKPWASRTPVFTTLERTPSPHVHCIVEKTVGPDDIRVETTWQDDQGGVGVGTSPGQAHTISACTWSPGLDVGMRPPSHPQAACPARAHTGKTEAKPAADRERVVLPKESSAGAQGHRGLSGHCGGKAPSSDRNSFELKGAGWPGERGCGELGAEGWAESTGVRSNNCFGRRPCLGGEARELSL